MIFQNATKMPLRYFTTGVEGLYPLYIPHLSTGFPLSAVTGCTNNCRRYVTDCGSNVGLPGYDPSVGRCVLADTTSISTSGHTGTQRCRPSSYLCTILL